MSFVSEFNSLPLDALVKKSATTGSIAARETIGKSKISLADFAALISPAVGELLEPLSQCSQQLTQQRFGKVIRLFAPLYLSNECINNCAYCGFSRDNAILRVTLSIDEVLREARALSEQGFRNILLVAGEHPKFVSNNYLRDCVAALHAEIPSVSLEVGPMETDEYRPIVAAGADGLVVYQETYDRNIYAALHTAGPKRNFDWRLETAERAYAAGFRRLGIGALFGLSDWRYEAIAVAAHADFLLRHCWKAQVTISLPRLRPCAGEFQPLTHMTDRELVQLVCAFRLMFPDACLVALDARTGAAARRPDSAWHHAHQARAATPNRAVIPSARAGKKSITPNEEKLLNSARVNGRRFRWGERPREPDLKTAARQEPRPTRRTRPASLRSPTTVRRAKWRN